MVVVPKKKTRKAKNAEEKKRQDVPKDEKWYWTPEWQESEKRAKEDLKKGRCKKHNNPEDFLEGLKIE